MKKILGVVVVLIVLASAAVSAYAQAGVVGTWSVSVQGLSLEMVLAQDGEKISGTMESPHGKLQVKGEFSNGRLNFTATTVEPSAFQISAVASLNTDSSLSGKMTVDSLEMPFTAARSKK